MRMAKKLIVFISDDSSFMFGTLSKFQTSSTCSTAESAKCLY